jgi:hypothetical protein
LNEYLSYETVSLIKKIIAIILSCAVVLVPFSRIVPNLSTWLVRDRMRDLYRRLRLVEAGIPAEPTASRLDVLQSDLESIEKSANLLGVPIRHSDLFFELKTHIHLVRQRLESLRAVSQNEIRKVS